MAVDLTSDPVIDDAKASRAAHRPHECTRADNCYVEVGPDSCARGNNWPYCTACNGRIKRIVRDFLGPRSLTEYAQR